MLPIGPNFQTNMEQINTIFPQLNPLEISCLSTSLKNEYDRWTLIIDKRENPSIEDYEYELIKLDSLVNFVDEWIKNNESSPISFGRQQAELLIETMDNEYEKVTSEHEAEVIIIVGQVRHKIRKTAVEVFGPIILETAHLKSSL